MPGRPVYSQQETAPGGCHQAQHLLGEEPVIEAGVAQEAVEAGEGTAELDVGQAGELAGDGEARRLHGLTQGGHHGGAGLLLRETERSQQNGKDRVSCERVHGSVSGKSGGLAASLLPQTLTPLLFPSQKC